MKQTNKLAFVYKIGIAMAISFALNLGFGYFLKKRLSHNKYELEIDVVYDTPSTMELHYDTGNNFNNKQEVIRVVSKGSNKLQFPFEVENGQELKFIRLDFGIEETLSEIRIKALSMTANEQELFSFKDDEIVKNISFLQGVQKGQRLAIFNPKPNHKPFDPYIVFVPLNELVYPLWQRTLLLVIPWFILFFVPSIVWIKERFTNKEFAILLVTFFFAAIPLKIAWVTFTSLMLLVYALIFYAKNCKIKFTLGRIAVLGLFLIPLLFLGGGDLSKLAIPLGFVLFSVIFSILDLSEIRDKIKVVYTKIFFWVMSITIINWLLLISVNGYFYNINISNYFSDIKSNAHLVMDWLYYSHTTFLSFFILIGGIFCMDLFRRGKITKNYGLVYGIFSIVVLLLLGSRFALFLGLLLPFLFMTRITLLKKALLPLWGTILAGLIYLISKLDSLRTELWKTTINEIKENFWFGQGTGVSSQILPKQFSIEKNGVDVFMDINHSHNQFLTYLLENGVLGTFFIIGCLLLIYYNFAKQDDKVMVLITFSIFLLMVIESPFVTATPLYLFSFLWCCFSSSNIEKQNV